MEFLDFVNENDEIIGNKTRSEIYEEKLLHRIVHVILFDNSGKMAIQLRGRNIFKPLHWCSAAAGHVKSGESYETAGLREMVEEIGVETKLRLLYKDVFAYENGLRKILGTLEGCFNGKFKINKHDVECIEFFTIKEIQEMIDNREKFHPEFLLILKNHYGIE